MEELEEVLERVTGEREATEQRQSAERSKRREEEHKETGKK